MSPNHDKSVDLEAMRHSAAHLLAAAVQEIYPEAKFGVGPVVGQGFYYDMDLPVQLSPEDLPKIEKKMAEIKKRHDDYVRQELPIDEAIDFFKKRGQDYKVDLLNDLKTRGTTAVGTEESFDLDPKGADFVSTYTTGTFVDLCRGPHIANSKDIGAFKLTKIAGAYWRGKETNKMLQRVYGLAFTKQSELDEHLAMIAEAEKRDHRKVGTELDIFMFHPTAPGMPYWLPKGVRIYNELIKFWRKEHFEEGYQEIISPLINKKDLYITSGHYEHYWSDMFVATTPEGEEYGLKAMNCPNAMIVFGSRPRSYRELPLRLSDTDTLHRFERSGTLNGLLRVREFRQDDAHIFVSEDQIGSEFKKIFSLVEKFYSVFGMTYSFRFGTRPDSFLGDIETWNSAENTLRGLLEESGQKYITAAGDGAFYGPKVDILMNDSLGREWQMGTIQLDFQQPRRFELEYTAPDGSKKTPIAIHRVIYGSMERFIGILIEHFAGAFPVWLSPVQVAIIPVGEGHIDACQELADVLKEHKIKVEVDNSAESVGKKIRKSESSKIPYSLVIGDKEVPAKGEWQLKTKLAVRRRGQADLLDLKLEEFVERVGTELVTRHDK